MPDGQSRGFAGFAGTRQAQRAFARLEDRVLLAAQPVVEVTDHTIQLGNTATVTVSFDNQPNAAPGGDVGYAPYIDLVLPKNGADGGAPGNAPVNDGVSFLGATFLGAPVETTVIEFDNAGQAVHPFARDASGNPLVVRASDFGAAPGDELVVLRLPFGSFVADQPRADVSVTLQLSPLADIDAPLVYGAQGGFAYGLDPLNNPTVDPPIRGAIDSATITPNLFNVTKVFSGSEAETATGPNFPRSYTITFDLAAGQTVTDTILRDVLPDGIVVIGPPVLSGAAGTAVYDPLTHTLTTSIPGPTLGVSGAEITVTLPFYVGQFLTPGQPGTPVLNPADGAFRPISNDVSAEALWTPLDGRDPTQVITYDPPGPENTFTAKSIAVQKSQALAVDVNAPGLGPGDTIEYTIQGQVSDYFAFGRLVVSDVLSDGQSFLGGSATLAVTEAGGTAGSGAFLAGNIGVARDGATGLSAITFNLSDQLIDAGAPDGVLTGSVALGAATFTITFRTTVDRFYVATGEAVGQGDALSNTVSAGGDVIGPGGIVTGSNADTSGSSAPIATGSISKEIYALNGTILAPGTPVSISSGDEITFRLTYGMPQTLAAQLDLRDFLPLPVFDVTTFTLTLLDVVSAAPPALDTAKWGPLAGGFDALLTEVPIVTLDAASNSLTFTFRNLEPTPPTASVADILFTLRVADRPFGDGLLLTNQLQTIETSASGSTTTQAAIRQLTLNEPILDITKGVVAFDGSPGVLSPSPAGPVSFTAPGSAGVRFSGVIDSTNLAVLPINSDLLNMDAGDRVTFAIVVENTGRSRNGAFDISLADNLPQGFVVGPGGLNLQVTDGAGNALAYTTSFFPGGGLLTLTDPGPSTGALAAFAPTGGANIVVITYDLVTTNTVQPRSQITNLAEITNFAAFEGGVDRVPNAPGPTQDTATVTIGDPSFDKQIVATSVSQTANADLTIGETITFDLVATLREGRIRDLVIEDVLPGSPGRLDFVSASLVSIGASLFERNLLGQPGAALGTPTIAVNGQTISFTFFNDIVNVADNVADAGDQIRVRVVAVAANVPGNTAGAQLENTGNLDFTVSGSTVTLTDTAEAKIVSPIASLSKSADKDLVQGGDIVTYTVVLNSLTGTNAGPAFDITASDPLLPGSLTLIAGSATLLGQPTGGATISEAGGIVTVTAPVILPGEQIRFTYQARVEPTVNAGTTLPNTVAITADSYPGVSPTGVSRNFATNASESVRVPGPGIVKTVAEADTSLPETGSNLFNAGVVDLAIGEVVTYRLTVTLPEAVSTALVISDLLPGAVPTATINQGLFQFLSASIVRIGASLSGPGLAGATPVASDTNGDGIADTVTINFGDVTNTPDGIFDVGDEIEVTVTARVRDAAANVAGREPINFGEVSFGGQIRRASALVDIVEPNVGIAKTANDTSGDAGDRVTFTVSVPIAGGNTGPAYNVTVTDTVPVGFTIDTATLAFVTPILGATLAYDPGTRLITAIIPTYTQASPLAAIRYDAVVDNSVRPAEVLTNTATLTYTSHPGAPADEFQRDYGPKQDSESFTIDLPSLSKRVVATDIPSTGFRPGETLQDVAIGETVTYLVTLRLPEVTTNLVLTDFLPVSQGAPPNAGDMRLISAELIFIGANITGATLPPSGSPGVQTDSNGDGIVNRVDWNFGTVTNLADNIQDAKDLIIVEVVARVINVPANQPGDRLINTGQAQYSKADGSTALITQTETVQIVGPELAITKTPSVPSGDAGDLVTYTVTVNHVAPPGSPASTANAFGVVLDDLLAPGLALVAGSVTASIPAATVLTGNGIGDTTIRVALEQYALSPATALVITYQARLTDAVRPGTTLPNTADLDWQSAPTGFPDARADNATADAAVAVVFPSAIDKTVTGTSLPETPGTGVEPGETITYTITLTLGEGTQQVLLTDVLPSGLSFVSGSVTAIGSNISGTAIGVGAAPVVAGQGLSFDFGNAVVNAGDNVLDARDRITVQVTARVLDVPGNAPGTVLTNNAVFTTDTGTLTDTAPVTVVSPSPVITKGASIATGDAGDLVTFTVVVAQQPGATGPLYDLNVTDALGSSYVLVAGSAVASRGVVSETGNTVTLLVSGAALLPGDDPGTPGVDESRITLTYQARLADSVQPGDVVPNLASFTGLSAPTGTPGARPFGGTDDASVTVVMPVTLDKAIVATSLPGTPGASVSVGETITYRLTATLSEGTQTLVIADTLPAGLEVVSTAVAAVGTGVTAGAPTITVSGQGVSFDFGTVVNAGNNILGDGTVAVEIIARVRDVAGNVSGTTLTNAGTVTIASPDNPQQPGGTQTDQDNTTATVVAPSPVITKDASIATGDAGDLVTFTVIVAQQAGATGPLYDLNVTDALGPSYVLVAGSAVASRGAVSEAGNTVTLLLTGLALDAVDNPGTPGVDESRITLTYQARLADSVQPGDVVPNLASFTGLSAPTGTPGARPFGGTDDASVTVVMPVTLDKAIVATSLPGTPGASVSVGETITYRLTATLSEGTQTLVIADTLPAGLEVVSTAVAAVGTGVTAGAPTITVSGQGVSFDFGTVVNAGNNILGDGTVAVEIIARVRDVAGNVSGTTLTNAGTVTIASPDNPQQPGGTQTDQDNTTATVVAPDLLLDKSVPPGFVTPGEVLTYTVTLNHTAASTAPAYDILLTDLLTDSNLRLVAGSVTTTLGSIVTGNVSGDTTLSISIGELALGSGVTITYQAQVLATTPPASLVSNAATAGYDSNPGPGGRPGDTGDETVTPVAPGFAKTIASTSNPDTGSGQFDPTAPDLAVGETLTYRLTITLPPGTTNELVLTDLLPQALLPTAARVASVGSGLTLGTPGIVITGQAIRLDFGTVTNGSGAAIGAEDVITVEVDARVIDIPGLPAGSSLVNAAALGFTIDGRTGNLTATAPADLVDPALTIDKTVNRLTGDAGDVFTYTVTVAQGPGSSADAYDIRVTDALDPRLILVSASSTDGTVGTAGNTVTLDLARFALNAAPVVLTYTVRMADTVEPGTVIGNTANLGWDSNPGPGGRPGTGTDSAPDLTAVFGLGLDKAIVATSLTGTTAGTIQPGVTDLAIGETVTYEIVARLSEGTQRVVISDTMPDGFLPILATVVTTGASISAGLSGTLTPTATITGQAVGFDFGTLVNAGDNLSNAGDLVTVRITARVLDTAINATGRVATNDAQGVISSPTDPGAPGGTVTNQDSVPAAIVEPALDIAKAVDRSTGDAGDVFTYTLTLTTLPGATGPAYNVVIDDPLAAALIVVPGSLSASFGTATIIGNAIRVTIPELAPNAQPITITYQAAFADTIEPGQVVPNTATLAFSSAPTDGRTYGDSANAAVTGTFTFALDKAIVATSLTGTTAGAIQPGVTDLAIGETVTYELVARLSEGTQRLVIADTMPDGFLPITATVVTTGASISAGTGGTLTPTGTIAGQGITFDFGTLVNAGDNVSNAGDLVTVRITARVLDISLNTAGRIATNDAEGTISAPTNPQAPGGTLTDGATVPAAIVEPALDIAKAVDRSTGDAGDVFTYTLTLTTLPGATGPAYNVVIDDPLAAALIVVPGSLSASFGTATIIGNAIRLTIPELAPNAQPITITYQAAFADTIEPGQVVPNTATLAFSSAPTDGRSYTDSASASATGSFTLALDKAIVATSLVETTQGRIQPGTTDLAIGEVVTYELVARLSEGTQRLVVTDAMPAGLLPLATGTVVITTGGSISAGLGGTLAPTATITGQTVTFDFGTLVNRGDNVSDAGDLVTIRIAARVQDLPVNVEGRLLTNNAGATATAPTDPGAPGGTLTAADSVTAAVVIPRFDISKAVDHTTGDAGEVFTYTLVIRPEAGNTGPAYNILVEDPLSPLLRAVPGSITTTAGTASLFGNTITISIPVLAADAAPVTITYQAAFTDALEPGLVVPNTAGLAFSTAPTDGRGFTDSASTAVRGVFTLALDKQVVATSLPETGSGYFNPALQDLAAGETVTYWLTATLSEGTQRLVITDTLPTGLTAEAARLVSLSPGITAAAPAIALSASSVTFDFGTVVNTGNNTTGDQVVVEVIARVGPGLSAPGTVLPNTATASVTAPGSPGAPGGTLTATDDAAVETVAAALVFDKSVGKPVLGLGESTTYTLVLSHAAGSTAPAYAVVLSDALSDASLALVTGSVTTTAGTITQGNNGGDTGVTVTLPILLPGETLTVTFLVRTIGIPIPDGIAPNTAVFDSTSAPGTLPPGFGRPITGQDTAEVLIVSGGAPVLGTLLPGLDEGLRRLAFSPYAQPIILTGTAQPGATVTLGLSQAGIGPLGIGSTQADVGGNWLAILPEPIVPRFDEIAFQELREAVGRIPAYSWNLPSVTPLDGPAARGGEPYTFIASSTVSAANLGGTLGAPVSATFAGAIGPGGYFTGAAGALGGSPGMGLLGRAVDGAVGGDLAFNAYALDFLAAHVRASALGR